MRVLHRTASLATLCVVGAAAGCHSAFIDGTLRNGTDRPISLVELDYPSASFGTQTLNPNQSFSYRFKVLGSGRLKLIYTDAKQTERHAEGPNVQEGDEGGLTVTVTPAGTTWSERFTHPKGH